VRGSALIPQFESRLWYIPSRASQGTKARVEVGDKIRVDLHHGKIEDAVVRAVIEHTDGTKLQVDVVGHEAQTFVQLLQLHFFGLKATDMPGVPRQNVVHLQNE